MSDLLNTLGYVPEHDVAAALGVEVATLRNWRSRGVGPAYSRAGGALVYPLEAIREWLAANVVTPAPSASTLADGAARRPGRPRKDRQAAS